MGPFNIVGKVTRTLSGPVATPQFETQTAGLGDPDGLRSVLNISKEQRNKMKLAELGLGRTG